MKKFLLRGILPRFLSCILCILTFLPHPRTNVFFSHTSPSATTVSSALNPSSPTPAISDPSVLNHSSPTPAISDSSTLSHFTPTPAPTGSSALNPSNPTPATTISSALNPSNPTPMSATNLQNTVLPNVGSYACVLVDNAFFYSAPDEKRGLFLLPKTYYVRLVEYRADYCKIEYQSDIGDSKRLVGYARTDNLTFVSYIPQRPYLYYVFDLSYKIEDTMFNDSTFLTEITLSCVYYGDYIVGSECFCYVLRGDEFGYVPKPTSLYYEENTEYADYLASLQPEPDSTSDSSAEVDEQSNSPAQIAILVAICLLVPILAALVLKPPRRPPYETDE